MQGVDGSVGTKSMLENLLFIALGIPSVFYLLAHSWPVHLRTLIRALVVWAITTSPIFIAAAFRDAAGADAAGSYYKELLTFFPHAKRLFMQRPS